MMASNRLSHLMGIIAQHRQDVERHSEAAAQAEIAAGSAMIEAKELCAHGECTPWRKQTGLTERTAQRWMRLARSGLKPATVADLGGIGEADRFSSWMRAEGLSNRDPEDVAECIVEGRKIQEMSEDDLAGHLKKTGAA